MRIIIMLLLIFSAIKIRIIVLRRKNKKESADVKYDLLREKIEEVIFRKE